LREARRFSLKNHQYGKVLQIQLALVDSDMVFIKSLGRHPYL